MDGFALPAAMSSQPKAVGLAPEGGAPSRFAKGLAPEIRLSETAIGFFSRAPSPKALYDPALKARPVHLEKSRLLSERASFKAERVKSLARAGTKSSFLSRPGAGSPKEALFAMVENGLSR
jgi:hypothetical protein